MAGAVAVRTPGRWAQGYGPASQGECTAYVHFHSSYFKYNLLKEDIATKTINGRYYQ